MKRAAVIILFVFTIGLIMSSCSREVCPAMSDVPEDDSIVLQA